MRARMLNRRQLLAAGLVAFAAGPAAAQSSSSGSSGTKYKPPTEIGGKSMNQWIAEITHRDPSVRETAIRAIPYFGDPAKAAVPALLKILKNDVDASCRVHAAITLSSIAGYLSGDESTDAVKVLIDRTNIDPQAIVRFHVVMALGSFGKKAIPAIPSLINRIHDPNSWELRRAVVSSLASVAGDEKFGPDARAVTAVANLLLADEDTRERSGQVRVEAVMALGGMGRPVQQKEYLLAKQALVRSLKDTDKPVQIWARVALMVVEGKFPAEELSEVARYLKGKELVPKVHAARALLALGKEAKSRIPDIVEMLEDKDPMAVATAIDVLGDFGATAREAVPALEKIAEKKDQDEYFKTAAKAAIEKINNGKKK